MIDRYRDELAKAFARAEDELGTLPAGLDGLAKELLKKSNPLLNGGKANLVSYLLPYWVGEMTRSPMERCRELAVGNLYAMLHFFLLDDAIDADAGWTDQDRRHLLPLGQLLHGRFLRRYQDGFPSDSPLWSYLEQYMEQWAVAMALEASAVADPRDYRRLAGKAAPVKICAAALLLESGKTESIPGIEEAVELALATLQLSDDYADWQEDLGEPGGNAFLTLARELLGTPDISELVLDEAAVRRAIYHRGGLAKLAELAKGHEERLFSIADCPPGLLEFQRSIAQELSNAALEAEEQVNRLLYGDRLSGLFSRLSEA